MKKTQLLKNRILAFVLSIVIVVCSLPLTAIADQYYGPLDNNAEIIKKTNFATITGAMTLADAVMVQKYSSINIADGTPLHRQNLTMTANDYVTVKLSSKFNFNNKNYDIYLKVITKVACDGMWRFDGYYSKSSSNRLLEITAPNTTTTGENLDFELWLQDGDNVVDDVALSLAITHFSPNARIRPYSKDGSIYVTGFNSTQMEYDSLNADWKATNNKYYSDGINSFISYGLDENGHSKMGYRQTQAHSLSLSGNYLGYGIFTLGYFSTNLKFVNGENGSTIKTVASTEGARIGTELANSVNSGGFIGWKANKDVILKDGTVIEKGETITKANLENITITENLTLTTYNHEHQYSYTFNDNIITAKCDIDPAEEPINLELTVRNKIYTGKAYTGFTTNDSEVEFTKQTGESISVQYYLSDGETLTDAENSGASSNGSAPVKTGDYVVKVTVAGSTYTAKFSITDLYNLPVVSVNVADESVNAGYTPTQIKNGGFDYHPQIGPDFDYYAQRENGQNQGYAMALGEKSGKETSSWCTTEALSNTTFCGVTGSYFEWINNYFAGYIHRDYDVALRLNNGDEFDLLPFQSQFNGAAPKEYDINPFIEMNANSTAALYQDLNTVPGDIIVWGLEHAGRATGEDQLLEVTMGTAQSTPTGPDNLGLDQSKPVTTFAWDGITENTKQRYGYQRDIDGESSISNLKVAENTYWQYVEGMYVVPNSNDNQDFITRFSFVSKNKAKGDAGNYMDSVKFDTLIGNVKSHWNKDGTITVTGYYGKLENYPTEFTYNVVTPDGELMGAATFDLKDIPKGPFEVVINAGILFDKDVDLNDSEIIPDGYYEDVEGITPPPVHIHDWESGCGWDFDGKENVITATCQNGICAQHPTIIKLPVNTTDKEYDGLPYDDSDVYAAIEQFKKDTKIDNDITISYEDLDGNPIVAPTEEGSYKIIVTLTEDNGTKVKAENYFDIVGKNWYVKFEANNGLARPEDYVFKRFDKAHIQGNANRINQFIDIPILSDTDAYVFDGWHTENENPLAKFFPEFYYDHTTNYAQWSEIKEMDKDAEDEKLFDGKYKTFGLQGVQIREPEMYDTNYIEKTPEGLRFVASFDEKLLAHLEELYGDNIEYGFVVATEENARTFAEHYGVPYEDYRIQYKLREDGRPAEGQKRTADSDYRYVTNAVCTKGNGKIKQDHRNFDGYRLFTAVITYENDTDDKLKSSNIVARAYVKYTDANGIERIFYNDYEGSEKGTKFGGCSVSFNRALELQANN